MRTRATSISLSRECALRAAMIVEQTFPPRDPQSVYAMAAALNLLNAVIKTKEGRKLVSYGYIKGMAACMFMRLADQPMEIASAIAGEAGDTVAKSKPVQAVGNSYNNFRNNVKLSIGLDDASNQDRWGQWIKKQAKKILRVP